MSICSQLRLAGYAVQTSVDGDPVRFTGRTPELRLTAIVNYTPQMQADDKRKPDFSEREQSTIEVLRSAFGSGAAPQTGEYVLDGYGHKHRIKTVQPRGDFYFLNCTVTPSVVGS